MRFNFTNELDLEWTKKLKVHSQISVAVSRHLAYLRTEASDDRFQQETGHCILSLIDWMDSALEKGSRTTYQSVLLALQALLKDLKLDALAEETISQLLSTIEPVKELRLPGEMTESL